MRPEVAYRPAVLLNSETVLVLSEAVLVLSIAVLVLVLVLEPSRQCPLDTSGAGC